MLYINKGKIVSSKNYKVKNGVIKVKSKGTYYFVLNGISKLLKLKKGQTIDYTNNDILYIAKTF